MSNDTNKTRLDIGAPEDDAVETLLQFGVAMIRAGNTASRTREWMEALAPKIGLAALSVGVTIDSITVTVGAGGARITALREIGPPGINITRAHKLEQAAGTVLPGTAPQELAAKIAEIQSWPPRYSRMQIAAAISVASAGFAFLNGAGVPELLAAAVGGGLGQWFRSGLIRRSVNPFGVAALSAIAASGIYVLFAAAAGAAGIEFTRYPAGFIACVLFLVPGFPLIAALFDLTQNQTTAAIGRLAHGVMLLLGVALGLSIVIALAGVDLVRQPPLDLPYPLHLALRALASVVASCAFAMLFNSPRSGVLAAGLVALGANDLRLASIDWGVMLAPAAFLAAAAIGVAVVLVDRRLHVPRMAMVVPATVIMVPGLYAFEMIVLFNRGRVLEALQASASCGFVIGGLAMGLAAVRFFQPR